MLDTLHETVRYSQGATRRALLYRRDQTADQQKNSHEIDQRRRLPRHAGGRTGGLDFRHQRNGGVEVRPLHHHASLRDARLSQIRQDKIRAPFDDLDLTGKTNL